MDTMIINWDTYETIFPGLFIPEILLLFLIPLQRKKKILIPFEKDVTTKELVLFYLPSSIEQVTQLFR